MKTKLNGAPGTIRTSDPQIRSLYFLIDFIDKIDVLLHSCCMSSEFDVIQHGHT